jgi:hypothetical protein
MQGEGQQRQVEGTVSEGEPPDIGPDEVDLGVLPGAPARYGEGLALYIAGVDPYPQPPATRPSRYRAR